MRQVFESAKQCTPCIIFFDEFDSLAPTRGSGSTGVTDRLVNQLLCYLDGFEDIGKIYVLAASSRPNAIDPAVLRPGRIDKIIKCGYPIIEERKEIIKVEMGEYEVKWNIDIERIAKETEGFSGADINGILNNSFEEVMMKGDNIINTEDVLNKIKPKRRANISMNQIKNVQKTALM